MDAIGDGDFGVVFEWSKAFQVGPAGGAFCSQAKGTRGVGSQAEVLWFEMDGEPGFSGAGAGIVSRVVEGE